MAQDMGKYKIIWAIFREFGNLCPWVRNRPLTRGCIKSGFPRCAFTRVHSSMTRSSSTFNLIIRSDLRGHVTDHSHSQIAALWWLPDLWYQVVLLPLILAWWYQHGYPALHWHSSSQSYILQACSSSLTAFGHSESVLYPGSCCCQQYQITAGNYPHALDSTR